MRTRRFAVLLAFLACVPIGFRAQDAGTTNVQINSERMKADIQFMSSDELQGRQTLSPQSEIVGRWIASEFVRSGLKPVGNGYFQHFAVSSSVPDEGRSGLRIEITQNHSTVVRDFSTASPGASDTTGAELSGPVVFAGFGISAPEYGYDDLAGLDVRGKVLIVFDHEPAEDRTDSPFKGTWNTRYAYRLYKQQKAKEKGAIALLIVGGESRRHSAPPAAPDEDRFRRGASSPMQYLTSLDPVPTRWISESQANEMLKPGGKTAAELRREIDSTLKPQSFALDGVKATIRIATHDRRTLDGRNVVGVLEGSDPKLKDEYVVISAHYDHLGTQNGRIFHGADDNASGVAGLLEVMRAWQQSGIRPKRSLLFVAFEAEEALMVGSMGFVESPPVELQHIVADLNADMIGRDEDTYRAKPDEHRNSVNIVGTLYSPDVRAAVERANRSVGLTLDYKMDRDDSENMFGRSDQYSFALKNVPEVLFMTGFHPDYHTSRDTWDRIDYHKLVKITRLMFLTSLELADAPQRPRWIP
jgi:hypothetical protein